MCEVGEGVFVPFAVHANLTLNVCVKAPVHYWHNALHGGSHSDGMSAVGPFCVVHTHTSAPGVVHVPHKLSHLLPSLQGAKVCFISHGSFTASTPRWNSTA